MPELPEVEVVRRGLQRWVASRTLDSVDVMHPRSVRRHDAGPLDFTARMRGSTVACASRRGKYLWLPLVDVGGQMGAALVCHLGMSGQLLVEPAESPDERHLRVRMRFRDGDPELRFVDQRTFGGLAVVDLVDDGTGGRVPVSVAHIARDPLDPTFDDAAYVRAVRARDSEIKRILLDQTVASGVGNIYADEALWRSRIHGGRTGSRLTRGQVLTLLAMVREVMAQALEQGGTSFDALYVNVNGQSGYFARSLDAYGQEGLPCRRCGASIRRVAFMGRSSYFCPTCQRAPRQRAAHER
jgi:formamidopyrimidine-DNA glycosylase